MTILVVNLRGGSALHLDTDISDKLKVVSIVLITIFHKHNEWVNLQLIRLIILDFAELKKLKKTPYLVSTADTRPSFI